MEDRHHRNREMFLRLKDFGASHTDIPATTVWPRAMVASEELNRRSRLQTCRG